MKTRNHSEEYINFTISETILTLYYKNWIKLNIIKQNTHHLISYEIAKKL